MNVGRTRGKDKGLPRRVYRKHGAFYFVTPENKWLRLGDTMAEMYRRLAELECESRTGTMDGLIGRYLKEVTALKAPATQINDRRHAAQLRAVFGAERPENIRPTDVARYLDSRTAKVAANREKALLSHVFSKAMRWGIVDANPCRGVARNTETPRDRYPTHAEVDAVGNHASDWLRRFMRLAYLTGQRPSDVRLMTRQQIANDGIHVRQGKTGKKLLIEWTPALAEAAQDALEHAGDMLLFHRAGKPLTHWALNSAWRRAVAKAVAAGDLVERFQLRDMRAKAASDGGDKGLLGHASKETTRRVYIRTAQKVKPTA